MISIKGFETDGKDNKCFSACQGNWEKNGDHCYLWSRKGQQKLTWDDAEEFCNKEGGHLASVTSEAINEYIHHEKRKRRISRLWIGGTDKEKEGVWKWSDGSPWEFTKWNKGEPGNGSDEHCLLHFGYDDTWNDYLCTDENNFLCSLPLCSGPGDKALSFKVVRMNYSFTKIDSYRF